MLLNEVMLQRCKWRTRAIKKDGQFFLSPSAINKYSADLTCWLCDALGKLSLAVAA